MDFLNINQHGFRQYRSCVTQLFKFVHTIAKSLDAGIQTDVIYLDMAKAFDKVPHEKLLYKLEMVGIRGQLLAWFRSYLTNRRHRTVIEGYASDWRYVPSGVPQGSIIGPLLFLTFINDTTVNISADTNIPLYADDAKCFRELLSFDDHDALQKDLYSIEDWSDLRGMSFNASKCKHLNISKMKKPTNSSHQPGNNIIAKTQCDEDLGVLVDSKLSSHDHIINKVSTAKKVLRLIRSCGSWVIADVIKKLYVHIVRPHLDYASQVWSPHQTYLSDIVEAVQRRATKLMVGNKISYKERLNKIVLMSLSSGRIYLDLIFSFKCLQSYYDLDISNYLQFYNSEHEPYNLRNTELAFKTNYARTELFRSSFFPRVARLWNNLPISIRKRESLSLFKKDLRLYCFAIDSSDLI